ncbi:hypothetical protein ACWJJH_06555 [Endozoicomonadaceae bacterium StTr2]
MRRLLQSFTLIAAMLVTLMSAQFAAASDLEDLKQRNNNQSSMEDPNYLAMTGDLLIARPLLLATTIIGGVVFVVSSPFSAAGGNMNEAAETLVKAPARATFQRCLGCSR